MMIGNWRDAVVAEGRSWLGTQFHHQGRLKKTLAHKGGVDCLGLLVGIAKALEIREPNGRLLAQLDETDYTLFPGGERLGRALDAALMRKNADAALQPADIVLFRMRGVPQHVGIVTEGPQGLGILHAYAQARKVVEHALDAEWQSQIDATYSLQACFSGG